ncbi:MAG: hypothetical protein R2764_09755 [Bacteroidales bacterium]
MSLSYAPEVSTVSGTGASFKGGYFLNGNTLTVSQSLTFNKRVYQTEDWGSFREAVITQNKIANEPVIMKIEN